MSGVQCNTCSFLSQNHFSTIATLVNICLRIALCSIVAIFQDLYLSIILYSIGAIFVAQRHPTLPTHIAVRAFEALPDPAHRRASTNAACMADIDMLNSQRLIFVFLVQYVSAASDICTVL